MKMIWILIVMISYDANISMTSCSMSNNLVYRPNLAKEMTVYTFDTKEELEEYLRWSVETWFSVVDKNNRYPATEVIGCYYGKKIEVHKIYEEKEVVTKNSELKGYKITEPSL